MTIPIETNIAFGVPVGSTQLPSEILHKLETFPSFNQSENVNYENSSEMYNVLGYNVKLKNSITEIFTVWVNNLSGVDTQKWIMTTNWITENPEGYPMNYHRHSNCMYSAIIYFSDVAEEHPQLKLINPLAPSLMTHLEVKKESANLFNATHYICPYEKGTMLMFPSYLMHGHEGFKSDVNRKSFACNFFPVGKFGQGDSTVDTNWLQHDE